MTAGTGAEVRPASSASDQVDAGRQSNAAPEGSVTSETSGTSENTAPPADAPFADVQHFIVSQLRSRKKLGKVPSARTGAETHLTGNDRLLPVEQLDIYRQQFWLRHTASLVEDFPGLGGILGQQTWERLVEEYLAQVPSRSWSLRDLGAGLPAFVQARRETPHHALCLDMARLEWLYVEAFDAAEAPALDGAKLTAIDESAWPGARMVLHPSLRLLKTTYPVAALRRRLREAASQPSTEANQSAPTIPIPDPQPENLVLYRGSDLGLRYCRVDTAAMAVLEQLSQGAPLEAACEAAATSPELARQIEQKVGAWFADWGARGWIVDVHVEGT